MVRIAFDLREQCVPNLQRMVNNVNDERIKIFGANFQAYKYRNMFTISTENGKSCVAVGYGFNGSSRADMLRGYIEFNPNKTMPELERYVQFILMWSYSYEVVRWDLAIDIPVPRKDLFLFKDKRKYQLVTNSLDDTTEYLGQRNSVGYIKLYNKQIESKLDYPLTRLEVTMDVGDDIENLNRIPRLCVRDNVNDEIDGLSPTDLVLIQAMKQCEPYEMQRLLKMLNDRKQAKLKPYLLHDYDLGFCLPWINKLIAELKHKYCDFSFRSGTV